MGETIRFNCSNCGYEKSMFMGVGMCCDLEKIFNSIVDNVKKGKYGEEWKKELKKDSSLVVNISDEIYVCPRCGYFTTDLNLSLYRPVEKQKISLFQHRKRYGTDLTLESSSHYLFVKKYPHLCAKCNKEMLAHDVYNEKILPSCPYCGGKGGFSLGTFRD